MSDTNNKLLIRIDERQKKVLAEIVDIKRQLDCKVTDNSDYTDMKEKVYKLWDDRNKLLGWMLGAGIAGGGIATFLSSAVKTILANVR